MVIFTHSRWQLLQVLIVAVVVPVSLGGLLGAGTGAGSCPAFPYRSTLLDHVAGCPRWAECCTEFGYCHSKDSWLAGYFRDCNGESNGSPLPGSVIRIEALEAAKGDSKMTAAILGISSEIWEREVQIAAASLSSSSSSTSSSSSFASSGQSQISLAGQSQAGFAGQSSFGSQSQTGIAASQTGFAGQSQTSQTGFAGFSGQSQTSQTGFAGQSQAGFAGQASFSNADLVAQIVLALQPQVAQTVQLAVQNSKTSSVQLISPKPNRRPLPQNAAAVLNLSNGAVRPTGIISTGSPSAGSFSTGSFSAGSLSAGSSVDVSAIVAQVMAAITPEIARVVQAAV